MDLSHLDKKYFINPYIYNCPFCKRNNVSYTLIDHFEFDWSNDKKCYVYLVQCKSIGCSKVSLHWSWKELREFYIVNEITNSGYYKNIFRDNIDIDKNLFYSQPTSFFVLDSRIPKAIRELILESEKSRQANLLTGASACLRKAIYELINYEKIKIINDKTGFTDYKLSIKELKKKFNLVSPELFDVLSNIQEMINDPLHENSWEAWDSSKLRFLTELFKVILDEIYVFPDEKIKRLTVLNNFKKVFNKDKNISKEK